MPNGAAAEAPRGGSERSSPRAAYARGSGQAEKGLLVESVPRRMRVGVPAGAEVRIARDRVDALIAVLNGRGAAPLAAPAATRALSVRLRAPGGDFWVEPATPETQWVESASSLVHDDYAIWRWSVVARRRGRRRLALVVSVRTLGRDGLVAEAAPPDRVIEVKVAPSWGRLVARTAVWTMAILAGAVAGYLHGEIRMAAKLLIGMVSGG